MQGWDRQTDLGLIVLTSDVIILSLLNRFCLSTSSICLENVFEW
jgi:hypothetical protein